jgi:hypothetical protein
VSESTVTNPTGSGRKRRTMDEISDSFNQMLVGPEEQPERDSSVEEQPPTDSLDEGQELDAGLADDLVVDEQDVDEPEDEQLESDVQLYRVTVDDEELEVPLDELISGYHRYSTFTKKSKALAEERDAFGGQQQALMQERQTYASVLQQLRQQMEAAAQPNLDWDALERDNPLQWLKLKELERDRQGQLQAVNTEQVRMQQILANQNEEALQRHLVVEQTMVLEKIPEWSDADIQADEQRKVLEYGRTVGYSDEELNNILDHRALITLRNAWKYDVLINGEKTQTAKSKIGSAIPGNKETSQRVRSRKQKAMRQKLKATGKVDDAAALFGELLAD